MTEKSAIKLCVQHRDPSGFEFLVQKYRREAFFHAIGLLGNQEDAADACQESFARAFVAIPRLKELESFYPWFYRILRNCCLNMLSRKKTASDYSRVAGDESRDDANRFDPSAILEKQEDQKNVWRALSELSPENREILMLKYLKDYNYDAISAALGIPRGTVMSRLYHARKAFRAKYLKMAQPQFRSGKEIRL